MYDHGGMNRAYRLIWNRAKGRWIVAPEKAKGRGHPVGAVALAGLVAGLAAMPGGALADPAANALPTGGKVVAGSVSISENGAAMTVTQGSARGVVNWNSFDVGSSAAVTFKQPDAASVTLNRVTGGAGSVIAGKMDANGKVYVVNPAGVLFSKGAQVNVGGLVASTADIADQDFLAGKEVFTNKGATGSVVNQGTITAKDGGAVVLIGGTVSNQGTINARGGDAVLASGAKVTLNAGANGHLKIEVDGATTAALVENGGLISASGGRVLMTAQGASAAVSSVVANTGTVEARTIGGKAGQVTLLAGMQGGEAKVGGTIDASAPASANPGGGDGGAVETSAAKVTVAPGAKVTTLADKGKTGNWLIDPYNVTISTGTDSGGFIAGANDTVINVTTLTNALALSGVTVTTGSAGLQAGNITVAAPISWSANSTLTLQAAGSVFIDKDITATGNTAGLTLTTGAGGYSLRNGARVSLSGVGSSFAVNGNAYTMIRDATGLQGITGSGRYALAQDIDASATSGWNSGAGFAPIGALASPFTGTLAGLGHRIDGLTINLPSTVGVGMFGALSGTARDFGLSNVSVTGRNRAGTLVGVGMGGFAISNVHVTGSITGHTEVGGLLGIFSQAGAISGSSSAASVRGVDSTGGLVGTQRSGTITDSYATGAVSGGLYSGGLIGNAEVGTVSNVYASGKVTGTSQVGGLIGGQYTAGTVTVSNAYWDIGSTGQSTSFAGTGIATANARTQGRYTGFDFANTWAIIDGETRPMLRSQYSTVITTPVALQLMALDVTASYTLGADIDFGSALASDASLWGAGGFVPIANFSGTFDGQNHTVDRLTINRSTGTVGMFGLLYGTIRDLTLSNVSIVGKGPVGSVAGRLSGASISNVHVTGSVTGSAAQIGGLVGLSDQGRITESSSAATVSGGGETGGLVGRQRAGQIIDSYATGAVTGTSDYTGGLIGSSYQGATLTNVYASGKVTGTTNVGGLGGGAHVDQPAPMTATNAYWDTNTSGQATSYGGTGITSANARTQATYTGFDFTNTWVMLPGETRPMLRSQYSTVITTPAALQLMALDRTAGYKLGANIDFGTAFTADSGSYASLWGAGGFVPVGASGAHFTGSFDGQNHTITGLAIDRPSTTYVGLFGYAGTGAAISNVTLSGGTVTGKDNVGSLVGYLLGGTVTRAASGATVVGAGTGAGEVGGLIGVNDAGTVTSSSASGSVTSPGYDVGGLVGFNVNAGTVTTSFATGSVSGTGSGGGQGNIGGLVGANGYGPGTGGTISQSYATGAVSTAIGPAGGLVGFSQGVITDSYATGSVTGTGSASNIGGFIGVNANDGTIANAYSTGQVTGPSQIGGFAGYNNNAAGAITNAYWDSQTSGLGTGVFGGGGGVTTRTTAQLQGARPSGFSSAIWGTGASLYPYFGWSYATTPVAVSGRAYSDAGTTALAGATVTAVSNGASIGSAVSGANGYYYILGAAGSVNAAGALTYLDNHATKGAAFNDTVAATGITGLDIHGSAVRLVTAKSSLSATRTGYASTFGSFSDTDLSFLSASSFAPLTTTAGHGVSLNAASNYSLDGSLGSGGLLSLSSGGTFGVSGTVGLTAAGALTVNAPLSWSDAAGLTLTTTNSGNVTLGGAVSAPLGSLTIVAGGTATGGAAVNVNNFSLTGGTWGQVAGTLPAFAATDFRLTSGATFLRATGGDGSAGTPYRIADVYGLQGMGSTSLAATSFQLAGAIDASGATTWNAGAGFSPIGTAATPFTGTLDGQGNTISGLTISRPGSDDMGLFGVVGTGGTLADVRLASGSVTGRTRVGALAGRNQGTITGSSSSDGVTGSGFDVGGLVGQNDGGGIATSFATGAVAGGSSRIGGLAGSNTGAASVQNAYTTGSVTGNAITADSIGGLVGQNGGTATIANSYATGTVGTSGIGTVIGGLIGQVSGGTVTGSFWNTASSGRSAGVGTGSASGITGLDATGMTTLATFTGAGWSADDQGGTASTWRVYDGHAAPLLRGFLTGLTVTGGTASKTYDGNANSASVGTLTYNPTSYTAGQLLGTAAYTANSADAGVYSGTDLTLGGLYSTQSGYDITMVPGALTIDKAALTVTANSAAKTYDGLAYSGGTGVSYGGFVNGETAAVLGGALAYGGTAQGAVDAGSYSFTASGLTSDNYDIGYAAGTLTVGKAALTVTANDAAKTYDGLAYDGDGGVRYSGFVNGETAAVLGGTLAYGGTGQGAVNAGSHSVTASGLTSGNYDISYAAGTLTIGKAALTVTANDAAKIYDGRVYDGSAGVSYGGFVNGETAAVLGGALTYGGTAQGAVNAGRYSVTGSGLTSGNYDIGYAPGTLTIRKASLTVTANDASKIYDGLAYSGGAGVRYSGFVNGETASVLDGTLTYGGTAQGAVNAGRYGLTAAGLTSANYDIGYAPGTLTVNKAALVVIADSQAIALQGNAGPLTYTVGGAGLGHGDTVDGVFSGALSHMANSAVPGTYAVTQGTLALVNDNYALAEFVPGTVTVTRTGTGTAGTDTGAPTASTLMRATHPNPDEEAADQPPAMDNGGSGAKTRPAAAAPDTTRSSGSSFLTFATELIRLGDR